MASTMNVHAGQSQVKLLPCSRMYKGIKHLRASCPVVLYDQPVLLPLGNLDKIISKAPRISEINITHVLD